MDNNFIINPTSSVTSQAQDLASQLFQKFPNMTPKKPEEMAKKEEENKELQESLAKAQEVALATEAGQEAFREFEASKKALIDELIVQHPKGAEALKKYREKLLAIYKSTEAKKVENAEKATLELNTKYQNLQKENEEIKSRLDEVLKKLENANNANKAPTIPLPKNIFDKAN